MNKSTLSAKFDWLEFTVKNVPIIDLVERILHLPFSEFDELKRGRFGYNSQLKWNQGNLFIMYNSENDKPLNDNMGIHVLISGTGCNTYGSEHDIRSMMCCVIACCDYNFSRIDLAIDDKEERLLKYDVIKNSLANGLCTSRWSKWDEIVSRKIIDNEYLGKTIYLGSKQSDVYCRIYDKSLERKLKANENNDKPWTRIEMVYKKERANMLAVHIMDNNNIGKLFRATINNYVRFLKHKKDDTNRSRWTTSEWWVEFLDEAEKLRLTIVREDTSIPEMQDWVEKQVSPTLAAILTAHEGEASWLHSILNKGKTRLKQKHLDAISDHIKEQYK